jgi:hypothetical protein
MLIRTAPNDATVQNAKRNGMIAHCQRMNKEQCESTGQKMQIMLDEVRTPCTSASTKRSRTRSWQIDPSPSILSTVNRIRHRYPFSTIRCMNEHAHNGSKSAHTRDPTAKDGQLFMLIQIAPNNATVQNAKRNGMIAHCQRMNKGQCESTVPRCRSCRTKYVRPAPAHQRSETEHNRGRSIHPHPYRQQ